MARHSTSTRSSDDKSLTALLFATQVRSEADSEIWKLMQGEVDRRVRAAWEPSAQLVGADAAKDAMQTAVAAVYQRVSRLGISEAERRFGANLSGIAPFLATAIKNALWRELRPRRKADRLLTPLDTHQSSRDGGVNLGELLPVMDLHIGDDVHCDRLDLHRLTVHFVSVAATGGKAGRDAERRLLVLLYGFLVRNGYSCEELTDLNVLHAALMNTAVLIEETFGTPMLTWLQLRFSALSTYKNKSQVGAASTKSEEFLRAWTLRTANARTKRPGSGKRKVRATTAQATQEARA